MKKKIIIFIIIIIVFLSAYSYFCYNNNESAIYKINTIEKLTKIHDMEIDDKRNYSYFIYDAKEYDTKHKNSFFQKHQDRMLDEKKVNDAYQKSDSFTNSNLGYNPQNNLLINYELDAQSNRFYFVKKNSEKRIYDTNKDINYKKFKVNIYDVKTKQIIKKIDLKK